MSIDDIEFIPVSQCGGMEACGIDLSQPQPPQVYRILKAKCIEFGFLLVRNQDLAALSQYNVAKQFGRVMDRPKSFVDFEGNFVTSTGEIPLHFDHWLINEKPQPVHFTALYAIAVTPIGGETFFCNLVQAYNDLPQALKVKINDYTTLHCYNYSYNGIFKKNQRVRERDLSPSDPRITHPLVRSHPETRKQILYLSPRNTDRILQLNEFESDHLIEELLDYICRPHNVYVHKWCPKDFIIWDNYSLLHGRKNYDTMHYRKLRRQCIL